MNTYFFPLTYPNVLIVLWNRYDHQEVLDENSSENSKSPSALFNPILFSGMLLNEWFLDLGSLERLMWRVKRVIEIF